MKIKDLQQAFNINRETAKTIVGLINESINPYDFRSVRDWTAQCYNVPSTGELIMCALNEILEGFGVEAIRDERFHWDSFWGDIGAEFINMGDTYDATIIRDRQERFIISSYGDWVEWAERKKFNV